MKCPADNLIRIVPAGLLYKPIPASPFCSGNVAGDIRLLAHGLTTLNMDVTGSKFQGESVKAIDCSNYPAGFSVCVMNQELL